MCRCKRAAPSQKFIPASLTEGNACLFALHSRTDFLGDTIAGTSIWTVSFGHVRQNAAFLPFPLVLPARSGKVASWTVSFDSRHKRMFVYRFSNRRTLTMLQIPPRLPILLSLLLVGCATPKSDESASDPASSARADSAQTGLVVMTSPHSVDSTVARLERALEAAGPISIMAHVDHATNAETADQDLRPTQLLIFGNPVLGTPLIQASPTTAIDLPQKMLVWEDSTGQVRLAFNDPQYLADRHGITGRNDELKKIGGALRTLVQEATASTP